MPHPTRPNIWNPERKRSSTESLITHLSFLCWWQASEEVKMLGTGVYWACFLSPLLLDAIFSGMRACEWRHCLLLVAIAQTMNIHTLHGLYCQCAVIQIGGTCRFLRSLCYIYMHAHAQLHALLPHSIPIYLDLALTREYSLCAHAHIYS